MLALVVTDPFDDAEHGAYAAHQIVTDQAEVERLTASPRAHHFRRFNAPDPAPPASVEDSAPTVHPEDQPVVAEAEAEVSDEKRAARAR